MKSMMVLNQLRVAKIKKQQEKVQCDEVHKQLAKIMTLRRQKAALNVKLKALSQGILTDDRIEDQVQSLKDGMNNLYTLQEKLGAYRFIGPCGLTVADDVDTNCLVVTFTPMWKHIAESYILKIVAVAGQMKVSGTSIPYFVDVQSLLDKSKSPVWHQVMDNIGHILNAYVQRKGELDFVMKKYKEIIKSTTSNESQTSVEVILCQKDQPTGLEKEMCIYLVYPQLDSTLPEKAIITTEKCLIASQTVASLRHELLMLPLSSVMPAVVSTLELSKVVNTSSESDEDDDG
uniref:Centromere protein O n=2 Tax=Arion vulgaris TaxID=1028688 RepID=A0A0B7B2N4_9EUPU